MTSTSVNLDDGTLTKVNPEYQKYSALMNEFDKWFFGVKYRTDDELTAFFRNSNNSGMFIVYDTETSGSEIRLGRPRTYELEFPPNFTPTSRTEIVTGPTGGYCDDKYENIERLGTVYGYRIPEDIVTEHTNIILHRGSNIGLNLFTPYRWLQFDTYYCGIARTENEKVVKINARIGTGYWKLVPLLETFSYNILTDFFNSEIGKKFKYLCCTFIGKSGLDRKILSICDNINLYDGSVNCDNTMIEHCSKDENKYDISCGCMTDFLPKIYNNSTTNSTTIGIYNAYKDGLNIYDKYKSDPNTKIPRKCIIATCKAKSAYKIEDRNADCVNICRSVVNVNAHKYSAVDMSGIRQTLNCNIQQSQLPVQPLTPLSPLNPLTPLTPLNGDSTIGYGDTRTSTIIIKPDISGSMSKKNTKSSDGMSTNKIIAISLGLGIPIFFLIILAIFIYHRNK